MDNYTRKFHLLLYLEEIQQEIDIQTYDMDSVSLTKCKQDRKLLSVTVGYYVYHLYLYFVHIHTHTDMYTHIYTVICTFYCYHVNLFIITGF